MSLSKEELSHYENVVTKARLLGAKDDALADMILAPTIEALTSMFKPEVAAAAFERAAAEARGQSKPVAGRVTAN